MTSQKKTAFWLCIGIAILLVITLPLFIFKDRIFSSNSGLQVCPDEIIVDGMPSIDRSGESVDDSIPTRSSYYILNGDRKELEDFDLAWVGENCNVPVTNVQ